MRVCHIKLDKDSCLSHVLYSVWSHGFPRNRTTKCSFILTSTLKWSTSLHTEHWIVLWFLWFAIVGVLVLSLFSFWVIPSVINEQRLLHFGVSLFYTHTFLCTSIIHTHSHTDSECRLRSHSPLSAIHLLVQLPSLKEQTNILENKTFMSGSVRSAPQ